MYRTNDFFINISSILKENFFNFFNSKKVVARGIVVLSEQIAFPQEDQTNALINFEATPQMAPKARLVVYAIRWGRGEREGDLILLLEIFLIIFNFLK